MQLKSQRKTVFAAAALLAVGLAFAGCSKKEEPVAEATAPVEAPVTPPADGMATTAPADATAAAEAPATPPAETPPGATGTAGGTGPTGPAAKP